MALVIVTMTTHALIAEEKTIVIKKIPMSIPTPALYPQFLGETVVPVSAQAAEILDSDSGVVIYAKNPTMKFPMASTTKIMTALTALDYYDMDDILTVEAVNVPSVIVGFSKGEQVRFEDMLYAMLLPSGNDAAIAIADNYPGGRRVFVEKMNEKAVVLHLFDSRFADPSGLDEKNITTARDLARLAAMAMKNPIFSKVVSTRTTTIVNVSHTNQYYLQNINRLLGFDGVDGVKTGFTDEAGQVLVTSKLEKGHRLVFVVLRSTDRFGDTSNLLSAVRGLISYIKL